LGRGKTLEALSEISLDVNASEFLAIIGPSGCGKSTILRLVGALDEPTRGAVTVGERPPRELALAHRLGVAFQDHALLPWLTVWQNIALPYQVAGRAPDATRISDVIKLVGLNG